MLHRLAHKIVGTPTIANEHDDGERAQTGKARDDVRSYQGASPTSCRHRHRLLHHLLHERRPAGPRSTKILNGASLYRAVRTAKGSESTHSILRRLWRASTALDPTARCSRIGFCSDSTQANSPDSTVATGRWSKSSTPRSSMARPRTRTSLQALAKGTRSAASPLASWRVSAIRASCRAPTAALGVGSFRGRHSRSTDEYDLFVRKPSKALLRILAVGKGSARGSP